MVIFSSCIFGVRQIDVSRSLRGRRLKVKGKGVLGARETRGAREEGGFLPPPSPCVPRVTLAPKTPFPFPFKRPPRRLSRWLR